MNSLRDCRLNAVRDCWLFSLSGSKDHSFGILYLMMIEKKQKKKNQVKKERAREDEGGE